MKETLREVIDSEKEGIVTRVKNLSILTEQAARDGESPALIAAGLGMIADLAKTGSVFYSETIFTFADNPKNEESAERQTAGGRSELGTAEPKEQRAPKTFDDLLSQKIEERLLKQDDTQITKKRLKELLTVNGRMIVGSRSPIASLPDNQVFNRKDAIDFIKHVLEGKPDTLLSENYARRDLLRSFRIHANELDSWAEEVGKSWKVGENIDKKTTAAIRGLINLHNALDASKTERKPKPQSKDTGINGKSFDELLNLKVDKELLSPDQTEFSKEDLYEILKIKGSKTLGKKTVDSLMSNREKIIREEAINVIASALIEDNPNALKQKEFGRIKLMQNFRVSAKQISDWSKEAAYDWEKNPTVDRRTAIVFRGLATLNKLTGAKNDSPAALQKT